MFCGPFLKSLSKKQNLQFIPRLQECPAVFSHLMSLLQTEETFLPAFSKLFQSFHQIPKYLHQFFGFCFRNALKKSILIKGFDIMLSIVFAIPKDPYAAIDFFFSAFLSDSSILASYVGSMEVMLSFQIIPKCEQLPVSYLKFLIFTNIESKLSAIHIWHFFIRAPSLTLDLIDRYPIKQMIEIWTSLLLNISTTQNISELLDIQLNVFYAFLLSSIVHHELVSIFSNLQLQVIVDDIIFVRNRSRDITDRELALLSIYLQFCRINEDVSQQFVLLSNFRAGLSNIIHNTSKFSKFLDFFIWVLNPSVDFPMEGMSFTNAKDVLSFLPPPAFTFSSEIAPLILSQTMKIGIQNHLNDKTFIKFISTINQIYQWDQCPNNLLLGIANEDVLSSLIPLAMKDESYFYLLTSALSISCVFPVFSNVYSKIANNHEKLLKFLITLVSRAPLVNDFLRIDSKYNLKCTCVGATTTMWVRFVNHSAQIAKFKIGRNSKIYVKKEANSFVLEYFQKSSKFIPMNESIDGWHLICIDITPDSVSMSVNLSKVRIDLPCKQSVSVSLGKNSSVFDLQSFHVFRPQLDGANICKLFALGPNHKLVIDNFLTTSEGESLFVSKNSYISSLYLSWISHFRTGQNIESNLERLVEYSISPPFDTILTKKGIVKESVFRNESRSILTKRFYFESFFNSLDAHGGIPLIIHFLAEIILKKKDLHSLAFCFFHSLVNRFPFIHFYFEKNKVYQLVGQLLWKSSPDPKSISQCAMVIHDDGCIITNVNVVKYWFLGPSLFHCEYNDIISTLLSSLEGNFASDNFQILMKADGFSCIIKSISNSIINSESFFSLLMALALKITLHENAQNHALIIIQHLLVYHFNTRNNTQKTPNNTLNGELKNDVKKEIPNNSTVSLIHLLDQILYNYNDINVQLCSLLPMFIDGSTQVLNCLYELMMKYLPPNDFDKLIIVLMRSNSNPEFAEYISNCSTMFIFKNDDNSFEKFHNITIPLIYLLSHIEKNNKIDSILSLFSSSAIILPKFQKFSTKMFDHVYRILYLIYSKKLMAKFIGHDANSKKTTITPFSHFLLTFIANSVFKDQINQVFSFLKAFFALDHGEFSTFIMAQMFDFLIEFNDKKRLFNIVSFLFAFIPVIIRERITDTPPHITLFIQNAAHFIDFIKFNELTLKFVNMLKEIASISASVALQIISIVKECDAIYLLPNYDEIINRLESPMSYIIPKTPKASLNLDSSKIYQNLEENDSKAFLTLYCNTVHDQILYAESIFSSQEANDEIIEKWRQFFTVLNFPGSNIYSNCPTKYGIDDRSTQYQIRRVLFPLNPSLDHNYLNFWAAKYSGDPPEIRLTIKEVFNNINFSHARDIIFTGESMRLTGISIIRGTFVVTNTHIKFYTDCDLLVFSIDKIKLIRLTDYQHQPKGIFIEDNKMNSTLFAFETSSLRAGFIEVVEKLKINIIKNVDRDYLYRLTFNWSEGVISNMEYLLYLNFLSGRTWCDFTQFPIFPWVFTKFDNQPISRDFQYPFFAQTPDQKESCQRYFQMTKEIDGSPHHYTNYVSNVGSALYFLVRLEPFTTEEIEFQSGSLDAADRTFQSFDITSEVMTCPGSRSTLELVPEAYFMPDFLKNLNNIVFPQSPLHNRKINDVILPKWGRNPHHFVRKMRKKLESEETSKMLNEWIDLIWGVRRQGNLAEERINVFPNIIFEFNPDQYIDDLRLLNAINTQMHNCGQAPPQLFMEFHIQRKVTPKKRQICLCNKKIQKYKNDEYAKMICDDNLENSIRLPNGAKLRIKGTSIEFISNVIEKLTFADEISPTLICSNGNDFITAHKIPIINHWRCSENRVFIRLSSLRGHLKEITAVSMNSECSLAVTGHSDGTLSTFCLNPHCFLRTFECSIQSPVTKLSIMNDNSSILVFQNHSDRSYASLFSINGDLLSVIEIDAPIKDCVLTCFTNGVQTNYAFVLTEKNMIYALSMNSLKVKLVEEISSEVTSIRLWKNNTLLAITQSREFILWDLFNPREMIRK